MTQFPPKEFEEWFIAVETGDGDIPVPQSIADGEAWHAYIGRRQMALGAWLQATHVAAEALAGMGEPFCWMSSGQVDPRFAEQHFMVSRFKIGDALPLYTTPSRAGGGEVGGVIDSRRLDYVLSKVLFDRHGASLPGGRTSIDEKNKANSIKQIDIALGCYAERGGD